MLMSWVIFRDYLSLSKKLICKLDYFHKIGRQKNKKIPHIGRRGSHFDLPPPWTEMLPIQEAKARGSKVQIQLCHLVRPWRRGWWWADLGLSGRMHA